MNALQAALAESFPDMLAACGVPVLFGDSEVVVAMDSGGQSITLEEGGFAPSGEIKLKALVSSLPSPAPTYNDTVTINEESFLITDIDRKPNSPAITFTVRRG